MPAEAWTRYVAVTRMDKYQQELDLTRPAFNGPKKAAEVDALSSAAQSTSVVRKRRA